MPNVYKKSGSRFLWCWGYDVDGRRWHESTKQTDPKAAALAARDLERKYAADSGWKAETRLTLSLSLDRVVTFQNESNMAPATIRATTYHARHLIEHLGANTALGALTLDDTTRYMRARIKEGASRHTVAKEINALTQAMRRAEKLGIYKPKRSAAHFFPDELRSFYKPRARWMPRDEYEKLRAALAPKPPSKNYKRVPKTSRKRADQQDRRDYVACYCHLGLRKSELFDVLPFDYDAKRRELRVRGTKTDGADRMVPVNEEAAEVLARRCNPAGYSSAMLQRLRELVEKKNDPERRLDVAERAELRRLPKPFPEWTDGSCTRDLAAACSRAKIAPVTPNDLRRTFCSWLCQAGVPERVCAELMGHKSTVMVRAVYGHLDGVSMANAVAKIAATGSGAVTASVTAAPAISSRSTNLGVN